MTLQRTYSAVNYRLGRSVSDSVNSKTGNLTAKRNLHVW